MGEATTPRRGRSSTSPKTREAPCGGFNLGRGRRARRRLRHPVCRSEFRLPASRARCARRSPRRKSRAGRDRRSPSGRSSPSRVGGCVGQTSPGRALRLPTHPLGRSRRGRCPFKGSGQGRTPPSNGRASLFGSGVHARPPLAFLPLRKRDNRFHKPARPSLSVIARFIGGLGGARARPANRVEPGVDEWSKSGAGSGGAVGGLRRACRASTRGRCARTSGQPEMFRVHNIQALAAPRAGRPERRAHAAREVCRALGSDARSRRGKGSERP